MRWIWRERGEERASGKGRTYLFAIVVDGGLGGAGWVK